MGQYFLLINLDRRQKMSVFASFEVDGTICLNMFFSGTRRDEQLHNLGRKPFLALSLVGSSAGELPNACWGSWAGDRVVIVGDYSRDYPEFLTGAEREELTFKDVTLYSLADDFEEVTAKPVEWFEHREAVPDIFPKGHHVFMNLDKKEYLDPIYFDSSIDIDGFVLQQDGIMKALYSCLFYSTCAECKETSEDQLRFGRWAGNRLQLVDLRQAVSQNCTDVSKEVKAVLVDMQMWT